MTELYGQCFDGCNFNGTLTLHDGITVIGYRAFAYNSLKGELKLPKGLVMIGDDTFNSCDFSGELTIPASVVNIGKRAHRSGLPQRGKDADRHDRPREDREENP